jgi:cell division inhibitor SepF
LAGLVNRIKNWVGMDPEVEGEEDLYDELYGSVNEEEETFQENPIKSRKNNLRVLSHPSASNYEVMVVEPRTFDESLEVVNNLRSRKSLILNLHLLDAEQSQRVVDFISGATHAIDGHQQRVGDGVFVFTPNNVNIAVETEKTRIIRDAFWNQA